MGFKRIAGMYPHKHTKRRFYRWAGKNLGAIVVKHERIIRDYKGNLWTIRTFVDGKILMISRVWT
ncbi:hypothetical protein Ab1vBOLIVR2_gp20 [Agrobacterium phage OLIVR2]|uniref:Transposase n=1 Tax=Agrobacterium phage OLIVR1 TaxID=2723769 RepID=A0A858MXE2_9CAUD|nr:hypothetical protein KNU98_gp089 [Agrobacterium phage OLIVR1]QIW87215.1 hypothetical protein Ab1vBOLIVR1_gp20 [Agrobacterium phage OLIVR1]QIW87323.1 hypothetical protein Ab1vBOLIVR2_gp20 [Agrobacterium phage OLIVR2]QIW87430.1 hypothetical protein Ab1vBOLIVR3_gp20 [Agrobacterium phage OLIVR3]